MKPGDIVILTKLKGGWNAHQEGIKGTGYGSRPARAVRNMIMQQRLWAQEAKSVPWTCGCGHKTEAEHDGSI